MGENWIKKMFESKPKVEKKEEEQDITIEENQHEFNKVLEKETDTPEDEMNKEQE